VEIELGSDEILNPVQLRSIEPVTEPHDIAFRTTSESSKPIREWSVRLANGATPLDSLSGNGAPPAAISWNLTQEMREMILRNGAIGYSLTVTGPDGAAVSTPSKNIPLQLDTTITVTSSPTKPDNSADFLLVTFDFNSADLTRRGREDLKAIAARIGPSSEVAVIGYTDVLGESTRNKTLAEQRAKQVAEQLPKGASVTYRGANPEEAPYDNHLPEGRFLSRTVRVVVKNPR
jgi:outer membrane protein OmpA-like peptidoglycan-associated protein